MRVAALYDIHGNLPALEAVLREVREAGADQIVIGGDVVPGPLVPECFRALFDCAIATTAILGNAEAAVLAEIQGLDPGPMPAAAREIIAWTARELPSEYSSLFAVWPKTLRLQIPEIGTVLFCHGTPRHENEIFTSLTPESRLILLFADLDVDVVVCGHTHIQFDRRIGNVRVVNAGSVGMPFGERGADWLLLGPDVELRHSEYDLVEAANRIRRTSYPQAEQFAAQSVLDPPSRSAMLEILGRGELRYGE